MNGATFFVLSHFLSADEMHLLNEKLTTDNAELRQEVDLLKKQVRMWPLGWVRM